MNKVGLATVFFAALIIVLGCNTPPVRPIEIALNPPTSITITGGTNLPDRKVHVEHPDDVKRICNLITSIRGTTVSQLNFDVSEIECLTVTVHQGAESTELVMVAGKMAVPYVEHYVFYNSKHESELWDLMVSYLDGTIGATHDAKAR